MLHFRILLCCFRVLNFCSQEKNDKRKVVYMRCQKNVKLLCTHIYKTNMFFEKRFRNFLIRLKYFWSYIRAVGSIFGHICGRSKNVPKNIAICPGVKINHSGITNPNNHKNTSTNKEQTTNHLHKMPYFGLY